MQLESTENQEPGQEFPSTFEKRSYAFNSATDPHSNQFVVPKPDFEHHFLKSKFCARVDPPGCGVLETFERPSIRLGSTGKNGFCNKRCSCQCHSYTSGYFPLAGGALGAVLLSKSGRWLDHLECNNQWCAKSGVPKVLAIYYAPRWLPFTALFLAASISARLTISLSFPRLLPPDAEFFVSIRAGDCERIKELLTSGEASMADVMAPYGLTALNLALLYGQSEVGDLLIAERAPHIPQISWAASDTLEYFNRCSLIDSSIPPSAVLADLMRIYTPPSSDGSCEAWKQEASLEAVHFSRAHRSVLGQTVEAIEAIGPRLRSCIDDVDSFGRTALFWAARTGKAAEMQALLLYGANPEVADRNGLTSLHIAAALGHLPCVELLLRSGANTESKDRFGSTPLFAACSGGHSSTIELLLSNGADIEAVSMVGETPIMFTVHSGQSHALETMITSGASFKHSDFWGCTPLLNAVMVDSHQALQLLLARLTYFGGTQHDGKTLLHIAARNSDIRTIEMLLEADLYGLDAHALDKDGFTALEYIQQRKYGADLLEPFVALLLQVEALALSSKCGPGGEAETLQYTQGECDVDELFVDALEYQPL
jgi:ankyrin repeat protein